jgi:hypothetical protein
VLEQCKDGSIEVELALLGKLQGGDGGDWLNKLANPKSVSGVIDSPVATLVHPYALASTRVFSFSL